MPKDESPVKAGRIHGSLTFLEPVGESAAEALLEALLESRSQLVQYMAWDCWTDDAVTGFIEGSTRSAAEGTGRQFVIRRAGDGSLLGIIGLKDLHPLTPRGEVGYWIRSSMSGRGYATDALSALLKYCQSDLGLARVDACAAGSNIASQRVLRKCGFEREGFKRKYELCHGRWLDNVLFGKLLDSAPV